MKQDIAMRCPMCGQPDVTDECSACGERLAGHRQEDCTTEVMIVIVSVVLMMIVAAVGWTMSGTG